MQEHNDEHSDTMGSSIHNLILLGQILKLLKARQLASGRRATPVLVAGSNIWKREASATKIAGKGGERRKQKERERERDFFPFFISFSLQEKSRLTGCGGNGGSVDAVFRHFFRSFLHMT